MFAASSTLQMQIGELARCDYLTNQMGAGSRPRRSERWLVSHHGIERGTVLIGSAAGDHVSISGSRDSQGWVDAEIEVACDGWSGRCKTSFMKGELALFGQEVRALWENLSGTAKLEPREPNLTLTCTGDGKGHIIVSGIGQNHFETSTRLVFEFEIDQTFLRGIADSLDGMDPAA